MVAWSKLFATIDNLDGDAGGCRGFLLGLADTVAARYQGSVPPRACSELQQQVAALTETREEVM
jgi:hypothetical protein